MLLTFLSLFPSTYFWYSSGSVVFVTRNIPNITQKNLVNTLSSISLFFLASCHRYSLYPICQVLNYGEIHPYFHINLRDYILSQHQDVGKENTIVGISPRKIHTSQNSQMKRVVIWDTTVCWWSSRNKCTEDFLPSACGCTYLQFEPLGCADVLFDFYSFALFFDLSGKIVNILWLLSLAFVL